MKGVSTVGRGGVARGRSDRLGRWFDLNLTRVLRLRAAGAAGVPAPAGALGAVLRLAPAALRPRGQWPENTRLYAALRARLAVDPLGALLAFGAATATVVYLGLGPAGLAWVGALLRGPV